jgi:hypothetical protein
MVRHILDRKFWEFWVFGPTRQYLGMIIALTVESPNLWRGGARLTIAGHTWWTSSPDCLRYLIALLQWDKFKSSPQKPVSIWMTIWKLFHYVSTDCLWLSHFYSQDYAITEWHRQTLISPTRLSWSLRIAPRVDIRSQYLTGVVGNWMGPNKSENLKPRVGALDFAAVWKSHPLPSIPDRLPFKFCQMALFLHQKSVQIFHQLTIYSKKTQSLSHLSQYRSNSILWRHPSIISHIAGS